MQQLKTYKIQLAEIGLIFILFIFSIYLREDELNAPLSTEHEWITAHTLITLDIWENNGGPSNYDFNPIYTYPGKGNRGIAALGGVSDQEGNHYYVSYPPLCFIFAYYGSQFLGGIDVYNIRVLSLILQFLSAFLIYLIIKSLYPSTYKQFHIAAITGATLYIFSTGYLWAHSVLYFADVLVQPFILAIIYLFIKILKNRTTVKKPHLILLGIIVFLAVYTEWLALFVAFFTGIVFLIYYLKFKSKALLFAFIVTAISSSLSLALTIGQYSSISGFKAFKEVSLNKYEERSGHSSKDKSEASFNFDNPESFKLLRRNVDRNFLMAENFMGISAVLLIPFIIWRKSREKIRNIQVDVLLILIFLLSILLHYILFYNFNAIHNFSNLKTGLFMIITTAIILKLIEQSIEWRIQLAFGLVVLYFLISRGMNDFRRYQNIINSQPYNHDRFKSAQITKKYVDKDTYLFTNGPTPPSYFYISKHLAFYVKDTSHLEGLMKNYRSKKAWYFEHEGYEPRLLIELKLENGSMLRTDTLRFE